MFAIHFDMIALGIDFSAKLFHHVAVDGHASGHNQFLSFSPRSDTGTGNEFLQTNGHML